MTKNIQKALGKYVVLKNHPYVIENVSLLRFGMSEQDLVSINKSGFFYEYEVKVSRQDFLKDKKKKKWEFYDLKMNERLPNYLTYVCPENLIKEDEIPPFAGLLYYIEESDKIKEIKRPSAVHREKHDLDRIIKKSLLVYSQRTFLGHCLMTYLNKEIKKNQNGK